jgi:predicted ATPase
MVIRTPDYRLRVFVSSTLSELAEERKAARQAILKLHLAPIMFESGARPHPAQELYQSYLSQSQVFIGIYWQSYGWIAPGTQISGLEDEYNLSSKIPRLIYIKTPAPDREPSLTGLLSRIRNDNSSSYTHFSTPTELKELVQNDLALLLTEQFEAVTKAKKTHEKITFRPSTNVPIPRNPLIGREQLLEDLCALLSRDDIALVTLTGAGGTGKSRLAIQIGLEMLDHFKDGVYMVMLEPIGDPNLVISTIAETLGIRESPGSRPIREMLMEYLRDKQMLLMLDNFEQVVEAAPCVTDLLETSPGLKCIVTSRTPLRLRAEKEIPVPPLLVPSPQKFTDLDSLSQYDAVELFIQRAQAVRPDFSVTNANAPAIAEVCYRLDGLPLAIELAAARIKLLTPQGLLTRLEHRFDLLRGGTRDLPERQRTLRSAIDWSYNLLNDSEKKLFRRLSIFIGGWTLDAAEAVCDITGDMAQYLDDTLASLIDNNLVLQVASIDEEPRFGMLSTIHEYAFDRLSESDEKEIIHHQHAEYFLGFVTDLEPRVRSAERSHWRQVLLQEFGNIRSVLAWSYASKKYIQIGQQIVGAAGMLWQFGGYIAEGRQWCSRMIALCDESTPVAIRAGLLCYSGELDWTQAEYSSAITSLDESLHLYRTLDDEERMAIVMVLRGMVASTIRDLVTATKLLENSVELLKSAGDDWYKAFALSLLGEVALYENNLERSVSYLNQSLELARLQGDPWCMMPALMGTGQMAVLKGDLANARTNFQEAVDLLRIAGDNLSLAWALNDLGHVMLLEGDVERAGFNILEGLTIARGMGNLGIVVMALAGTAALIARRTKSGRAARQADDARLILAARLCGSTLPVIGAPGIFVWADSKILYDKALEQVQSSMKAKLWDQGYTEGQSLAVDQAVTIALESLKGELSSPA